MSITISQEKAGIFQECSFYKTNKKAKKRKKMYFYNKNAKRGILTVKFQPESRAIFATPLPQQDIKILTGFIENL